MYLNFSDTAKYADVARNIVNSNGMVSSFVFFYLKIFSDFFNNNFLSTGILPLFPYVLSIFFRVFGVSDFSVILTSISFFIFSIVAAYFLSSKVFKSKFVGLLSLVSIAFSYPLIELAKKGASETVFIFLIILGYLLVSAKNKYGNIFASLTLVLLYFTRPHAFIFIIGIVMYYLLLNFEIKKALKYFILLMMIGVIFDKFLISPLEGKYFTYSILDRGINVTTQIGASQSPSDQLRGLTTDNGLTEIIKKVFYNLYNFYKAMPQIMNPYLFALFVISLFTSFAKATENRLQRSFKLSVLFVTGITFLVTALTIPFYRYLYPTIPLIYIVAVGALAEIISKLEIPNTKQILNKYRSAIVSTFLVLFFAVGQTFGIIFLDSRFERKMHNVGKAPIYAEMSFKLKEITEKDDVILTNLDTWGSWYGERKTIWFPLKPEMILPVKENIDYIYLTSYKIDDENYYMGKEWREIFNNPESQKILPEYKFIGAYEFKAEDNYENQNGKAILLLRTHNE